MSDSKWNTSGAKDSTSIKVILYTSKTLASGEHPLMLRIIRHRKVRYKSLNLSCDAKLWNFDKNEPRVSHPDKDLLESIIAKRKAVYMKKKDDLVRDGVEFGASTLINEVGRPTRKITVFDFFDEIIEMFQTRGNIGTANAYKDTKRSVMSFTKKQDLGFTDIDFPFLTKYETFLRSRNLKETTLSFYFRTLRSLYNKGIEQKIVRKDYYPFDVFKVSKFKTGTNKREISKADMKRIEALDLDETSGLFEARSYFLFSYYAYGCSFVDCALLKWSNVVNGSIEYTRAKTKKELNFVLPEQARQILEFYKPFTGYDPENYVFPILNQQHVTPTQINNRIHKVITRLNRDLKEIGKLAGIEKPLTSYVARHSFAQTLRDEGVPTSIISEAMGHDSEKVTQIYLKSFPSKVLDENIAGKL